MTFEYMVTVLAKDGLSILETLNPNKTHLIHMTMGVCGEAGELLDAIKKHVAYNKELDVENIIEELGDIEFYLEGLRQGLGIKREDIIEHNIKKLSKRYEGFEYSDKSASERKDKIDE